VSHFDLGNCEFVTDRLRVGPWHAAGHQLELPEVIAGMLTARTTRGLPEAWRVDFSVERANVWITERDAESPTLIATQAGSGRPVGLVFLHGEPLDDSTVDVRIGYLIAEEAWGTGLATELVAGLVEWARPQPSIRTLTGGMDATNLASARVLVKNGFGRISDSEQGDATYQLSVEHIDGWDG
jgi:RimJ/RimL family protein N-acetyltransferase